MIEGTRHCKLRLALATGASMGDFSGHTPWDLVLALNSELADPETTKDVLIQVLLIPTFI